MRLLAQMMLIFSVTDTGRSLLEEGVEGWVLPPYPKKRFIAWDLVDTTLQTTATNVLDYDQENWNIPGTAAIEESALETIAINNPQGAKFIAEELDMDEEGWDCWMNHYFDYFWEELLDDDLQEYFVILGWTQEMWDEESGVPLSEDLAWEELSDQQQAAATFICYFPDLWNMEVEIGEWTYEPPDVTHSPSPPPIIASPPGGVPQEAKVAPQPKCGSVAGDANRGGSAGQAKGCGRLLNEGKSRVHSLKGQRHSWGGSKK